MLTLLKHRRKSFRASYKDTILADNPLFYYRLGEASGTDAYDEVATTNNGTYYNTPTLGQTGGISGDSNTTVLFEQANAEYATTTTLSSVTSLLPCTMECFVKCSGASDGNGGIVFIRGTTLASGINIIGSTLGKLGYHWRGTYNTYAYDPGITLSDNTWYYVAVVVESTKATIYVIDESGTLTTATNSVTHSAINPSTDPWYIARDTYSARYFQGYIDEVAVYDQALSQSTLVAHAAAAGYTAAADYRSTVLADSPLFYYRLGESSGSTAYDEVAASSNGTYYNTPTLGQTGAISGDSNTTVLFEQANAEYVKTTTLSSVTSLLPCTIECFIKTSGASDEWAGIVYYRSGNNTASGLDIKGTTQGKLTYTWRGASNTYNYAGAPTLSDNTWYYVALVVESTKATFYVIEEDGTLTTAVNNVSHSALDCSGDAWYIALDFGYVRYFQGYIDEVAIYDQALSQSTLVAHAAAAGYTS